MPTPSVSRPPHNECAEWTGASPGRSGCTFSIVAAHRAFAVMVHPSLTSDFPVFRLLKGFKGHKTHRFENGGTNQLRKPGKREVKKGSTFTANALVRALSGCLKCMVRRHTFNTSKHKSLVNKQKSIFSPRQVINWKFMLLHDDRVKLIILRKHAKTELEPLPCGIL